MGSTPIFNDQEYTLLKELSAFPLVKDGDRYKTGRILNESEVPLIKRLERSDCIVTGIDENNKLVQTVSITRTGQVIYSSMRKKRRMESSAIWDFLYKAESLFV